VVARKVARPVRVLIVFNTVFLYGMERYVIELFDLLRPEVEAHFLLSYTTYRKQLPLLAEIERRGLEHSFFSDRTGWPRIGRPHSLRQAWQMLVALAKGNRDVLQRSLGCDAIYLPASSYGYFALLAAPYFRLRGRRVVFGFHDLPLTWRLRLRLVSLLVSDFVHHTRFGYEFAVRTNPYLARKKTFICPGRTQSWRFCDSDPQVCRQLEGKRNLLFVGQLRRTKGIGLLLEAFASLAAEYPDIHLQVLGEGPEEQPLRRAIASMGLESRVHLWGYRDDVYDFLRLTYLYIHPSPPWFAESFGRGVVEAMSQAVPAVCFRSGALEEIVVHQQTGLVCDEEAAACLASSIRRFLDDTRFRSSCARAASSRYQELYSDDQVRARWIRFLGRARPGVGHNLVPTEPANGDVQSC
jgi:glycosyltransferase involved in cell wall biosynthesis